MKTLRLLGWMSLVALLSVSSVIYAQSCGALLEDAFRAMGDNCEGLDRNTACYGYDRVSASFLSEVPDDFFVQPADVTDIAELETIRTAGLDLVNNIWGVAVMSLQADIPESIPGQAVTFVLMGDVEVESAVAPDTVSDIPDPVQVIVGVASANVRSGPGLNRNAIAGVVAGQILLADGISRDGDWVRVFYQDSLGWIARALLTTSSPVDTLPTLGEDTRAPMQAFYLRTGIGAPQCAEAPDSTLLVQSPRGIEVELNVNGANIRVGSTIVIRILPPGDLMEIIVLDGRVYLDDGTVIPENHRSVVCLSEPEDRGLDGEANDRIVSCPWSTPEFIPPLLLGEEWCILENVPASPLKYPVDLICSTAERAPFLQRASDTPTTPTTTDTGDPCAGFGIISPLGGAPATLTTFSWSPAPAADEYGVYLYDYQGNFSDNFFVNAPGTSVDINLGQVASGGSFQWEVIARQNGEPICNTGRTAQQTRFADPNEPPGGYGASAVDGKPGSGVTWKCNEPSMGEIEFTYSGLDNETTIVISWDVFDSSVPGIVGSGSSTMSVDPSGSGTLLVFSNGYEGDVVAGTWTTSPSGKFGTLPDLPGCSVAT